MEVSEVSLHRRGGTTAVYMVVLNFLFSVEIIMDLKRRDRLVDSRRDDDCQCIFQLYFL